MSGIEQGPQGPQADQERLRTSAGPLVSAALSMLESSSVDSTQAAQLRILAAPERKAARRGMLLDEGLILASARDRIQKTGRVPTASCKETLLHYPQWTWAEVNNAGTWGSHGLRKGRTLAMILEPCTQLTEDLIRSEAIARQARHGRLPTESSKDPFPSGILGDTWRKVDYAARVGSRGLAPGGSLSAILAPLRQITEGEILAAAERFRDERGRLPQQGDADRVPELRNLSWRAIDRLARFGSCGLAPGSSLRSILAPISPNGMRSPLLGKLKKPPLEESSIVQAAVEHLRTYGRAPTNSSPEPLAGLPGESWGAIDEAGRRGRRGLTKGRTVAVIVRVVREEHQYRALLTEEKILSAAREFFRERGSFPTKRSREPVAGLPFDCWQKIDNAGRAGIRGLAKGRTLSKILAPLKAELAIAM